MVRDVLASPSVGPDSVLSGIGRRVVFPGAALLKPAVDKVETFASAPASSEPGEPSLPLPAG